MTDAQFKRGAVTANGLNFHYLEMGQGPLALCLHGFPDSPYAWRYLMPQLAAAGYRVVAPFMRGYAPTSVASNGSYHAMDLGADACALHQALGGDERAVLIGHDWGALAVYAAALIAPSSWRRCVTMSVPPMQVYAGSGAIFTYEQIKRSFYFWFFQMQVAQPIVAANNMAFIDGLWADWSPGLNAPEDLANVKACLAAPENLEAAIGYYRSNIKPAEFGLSMDPIPDLIQPLLYLHGENDGCIEINADVLAAVPSVAAAGSQAAFVKEAGHFMLVEQPGVVNSLILDFLSCAA